MTPVDRRETAKNTPRQIEYHPYVLTATVAALDLQKEHDILATSFGGLSPIVRGKGGPLDPVLEKIAKRVSDASGAAVTQGQVLQLWLLKKGVPCVSCVHSHTPALRICAPKC